MPLKTSAISSQLEGSSGQPARDVLSSLNFLATDNSVTLTGCSPSVGKRAQYFRASLIFPAKTVSSQTRSSWMMDVRSRLLHLPVPQSSLTSCHQWRGQHGLLLFSRSKPCSTAYACDSLCFLRFCKRAHFRWRGPFGSAR